MISRISVRTKVITTEFQYYAEESESGIVSSSNSSKFVSFQQTYIHISVKRDPTYLFSTLVLPIILIGVITACGFLLPSDGDAKINVQLMALLTQAVYMSILSEKLSASLNAPKLVGNISVLMLSSGVGIIVNLVLYRTVNRASYPPPPLLLKVMSVAGLVLLAGRWKNSDSNKLDAVNDSESSPVTMIDKQAELSETVKTITKILKSAENQRDYVDMWAYIALVVDRIFVIAILISVCMIGLIA